MASSSSNLGSSTQRPSRSMSSRAGTSHRASSSRHGVAFTRTDCIADRWELGEKIEDGFNGGIFLVTDRRTGQKYAGKKERLYESGKPKGIETEHGILCGLGHVPGFARPVLFQAHNGHQFLIMTRLGKSLPRVLSRAGIGKISCETMLLISYQIIERLEALHTTGRVHMNIIPEHIVTGGPIGSVLHLTGFSRTRTFIDLHTRKFLRYHFSEIPYGCPEFASSGMHIGKQPRPWDDLESLGFILIYLRTGELPWLNSINTPSPEHNHMRAGEIKRVTPTADLTKSAPLMFNYMKYIHKHHRDFMPNYAYLKNLFLQGLQHICSGREAKFDWVSR